jgi:glycolate oxidase iron-sulfur subunit
MANQNEPTSDLIRDCSSCVKCGTCQYVCPVYSVSPQESNTPRGKVALVEAVSQGYLDGTSRYKDYLETCLLCGACEEACPNEVKNLSILFRARGNVPEKIRSKTVKGLVMKYLLGAVNLFRYAMKAGRTFQYLIFRRVPASSGMRRRFPMPVITSDRTLPTIAKRFFTEQYRGQVTDGDGPRVGIFVGCASNYVYPEVGETIVSILQMLGATVIVPAEQSCCGMPAFAGGADKTVKDLALNNLDVFEKYNLDCIVTGCASCGGNLKHNYPEILEKADVEKGRAEKFASKVMDINEFLARTDIVARMEALDDGSLEKIRVTYHHPCHLGRLQDIKEEPISLIRAMPGVEYVPMAEADRCCGMAGSFGVEHYDLSREINDRKIKNIADSGADIVVTACPGCLMHIRDGLSRNGHEGIEAMHIMVLLERRLKLAAEKREERGEVEEDASTTASAATG